MAKWVLLNGRSFDYNAHRCTVRLHFDTVSDLPAKGDAFNAYVYGPAQSPLGSNWYVDGFTIDGPQRAPVLTVTCRQPGFDWTWVGLHPIAKSDKVPLIASARYSAGPPAGYLYGYAPQFSNWNSAWDAALGAAFPLGNYVATWEIEGVDTVDHSRTWINNVNGTWPTGWTPPSGSTAGIYKCVRIETKTEPYYNAITGAQTTVYRCFATFLQAPIYPTGPTQLLWIGNTWT